MKAYIGNVDWSDEGEIFFYSVESEETLKLMKELIEILYEIELIPDEVEMYWGTNEYFCFGKEDIINFIDEANDITNEELKVFKKFNVDGFNIYGEIYDLIYTSLNPWGGASPTINQEDLDKIKPLFVELVGKRAWNNLKVNQK